MNHFTFAVARRGFGLLFLTVLVSASVPGTAAAPRPNILWITCEDTGPELGCYGDAYAQTPNLDEFSKKAMRYRVWSERLVSFVDMAPTLLSLAGMPPPDWMQGHAFMGPFASPPPQHLFGFRGRMDERYDMVRSVRNERYVYLRQYMPHLIYGQHVSYMFQTKWAMIR